MSTSLTTATWLITYLWSAYGKASDAIMSSSIESGVYPGPGRGDSPEVDDIGEDLSCPLASVLRFCVNSLPETSAPRVR